MTIAFQLEDIRESVYQWISEETCWKTGGKRLGDALRDKFYLRIQTLKAMLSGQNYAESAKDVREHWEAAISELNSDSLYELLNSKYDQSLVAPWDVCNECWEDDGPECLGRFLHSLKGLSFQFKSITKNSHERDADQPAGRASAFVGTPDFTGAKIWRHLYEFLWSEGLSSQHTKGDFLKAICKYVEEFQKGSRKYDPNRQLPDKDIEAAKSVRNNYIAQLAKMPNCVGT